MGRNRDGGDLDMILERNGRARRSGRSSNGSQSRGGRNENGSTGRSRTAGQRGAEDVQLWTDERVKGAASVRQRSREAEQRYRREQRRKRRRRQQIIARLLVGTIMLVLGVAVVAGLWKIGRSIWQKTERKDSMTAMQFQQELDLIEENQSDKPFIVEDFLTPNEYSRPGEPLPEVTEIFVHYTANAGTSAAQNRSYFENLGITGETSASAHFVIGYEGEIIQCIPLDEIAYAVKEHNYNSISIECCYLDEDGRFTDATYQSLLKLLGWLMKEYNLGPSAIQRHYDTCGKLCPKYYVEHEDAWIKLLEDLKAYIS